MNNVAILVGCQHYTDPGLQNLIGVNNDVDLMKETLINYCGCNQDMVFSFTSNDEYVGNPTGPTTSGVNAVDVEANGSTAG